MTEDEAKNAIEKVLATISKIHNVEFKLSNTEISCNVGKLGDIENVFVRVWIHNKIDSRINVTSYNDMFNRMFKLHSTVEFYDKDKHVHIVDMSQFGSTIEEINIMCDLMWQNN